MALELAEPANYLAFVAFAILYGSYSALFACAVLDSRNRVTPSQMTLASIFGCLTFVTQRIAHDFSSGSMARKVGLMYLIGIILFIVAAWDFSLRLLQTSTRSRNRTLSPVSSGAKTVKIQLPDFREEKRLRREAASERMGSSAPPTGSYLNPLTPLVGTF